MGSVWGGYHTVPAVPTYVRFCFLRPCGCPCPWQRKCPCAWAYGHPSGPRQLFFCAQAQNWPRTTAKRGKTFSNFSRCAKIEAPTRGLPFRAQSSRFRAPRRVKKNNLKKVLYRGDGVHMALTQPLSVVAPRGSLSYPTDRRPSLVPAKTAGK